METKEEILKPFITKMYHPTWGEVKVVYEDDALKAMEIYSQQTKNLQQNDVSGQLFAFFQWLKENKHRYMFTDDKRFVEEFLKASNLR